MKHGGRTIQEAMSQFGAQSPLANVNMAVDGYVEAGHDPSLPSYASAELISSPLLWPLGLHGHVGLVHKMRSLYQVRRSLKQELRQRTTRSKF